MTVPTTAGDVAPGRPRVLVLARNYPNPVMPTLGLWTQRLTQVAAPVAETVVVAPVPWAPPGFPGETFKRFRRVPIVREEEGRTVHHPRVFTGPGYALHRFESRLWWTPIRRLARRLHEAGRFDLVHAHFIYPEGVVAARLGVDLGVPVVTTEQAPWESWFRSHPNVGVQVRAALDGIARVSAVSEYLRRDIGRAIPDLRVPVDVLPNVVDDAVFQPPARDEPWDADQILFVGVVRRVKGLDILVRALTHLVRVRPNVRLVIVGAAFYRGYARDEADVRQLVEQLGLGGHVVWAGQADPAAVAEYMRRSAVVVVPSRSETFSAVTVEALASGTPVVATRCGGPEEILTDETGVLVPREDPVALAEGIRTMLERRPALDRQALHKYAVSTYGRAAGTANIGSFYARALAGRSR